MEKGKGGRGHESSAAIKTAAQREDASRTTCRGEVVGRREDMGGLGQRGKGQGPTKLSWGHRQSTRS